MAVSYQEAIEFIKEKGLLKDWTEPMMLGALAKAIKTCAFAYTQEDGKLTGLVFGYWIKPTEILHVIAAAGSLMTFVKYLKSVFPNCRLIRAYRGGKLMEYKVGKNL